MLCVQEERCEERKGEKERKTSGVKTFSELACPLTSACVCLCGRGVRAHPASSVAIKLPFPTLFVEMMILRAEVREICLKLPTNYCV